MMVRNRTGALMLGAVLAAGLACTAFAAGQAGGPLAAPHANLPAETRALLDLYPGAAAYTEDGRVLCVYGMPMTEGPTPDIAAARFLREHAAAFGVPGVEFTLDRVDDVDHGRFKVYALHQVIDGLPVEYGKARILVLVNTPGEPAATASRVVYAAAKLARPEAGGLAPVQIAPEDAVGAVRAMPRFRNLMEFRNPELVAYYGEGDLDRWIAPVPAWKFIGETPLMNVMGAGRQAYTFFVNAATGELIFARNEIIHADVTGAVRAWATPGSGADSPSNPPTLQDLHGARVGVVGGNSTFSGLDGSFTIPHGGTTPVDVTSALGGSALGGRWGYINNTNGTGAVLTAGATGITPPGPANLLFNPTPGEFATSQVNCFLHTVKSHDYIKDRAPTFTALDMAIPINVNISATCNAFFDGSQLSINFYRAGGSCTNTGFSSVVGHEYGHFIVNRRGLAQGAFGEGFSDTVAMLLYNDPWVARGFYTNGQPIRKPDETNRQYPCSGGFHDCGEVLGGAWWKIKKNFDITYPADGLARTQQLHVNWYLITIGGIGSNSAHPQTAIEVLTVDDDDGNINNGTPHRNQICNAFAQHNIQCPALTLFSFQYPDGVPVRLSPGVPNSFRVNFIPVAGTPVPGTGTISYRLDGGSFITIPMQEQQANQYLATIPPQPCGGVVDFYISGQAQGGNIVRDPDDAPTGFHRADVHLSLDIVVDDAFETDSGWTGGWPGDTASTGVWVRDDPNGTIAQPEDDHTPDPGVNCWFTGQAPRGAPDGQNDVDNGFTTLMSPRFNLAGYGAAYVSYWRWYSNTRGGAPGTDVFRVDASNDDGVTWTNIESISNTQNNGGWFFKEVRLETILPLTSRMRIRFIAEDAPPSSLVEAAVDDFRIVVALCVPPCPADFNRDGQVDFFDYLDFVSAFAAEDPTADFNGDGQIDFFDYLDFVNAFAEGCE